MSLSDHVVLVHEKDCITHNTPLDIIYLCSQVWAIQLHQMIMKVRAFVMHIICVIKLYLLSPFWKQIWFWVIVVLLFIIITFTIVRWRTYRLRNEKERLEKIVDRRTKELQTRNEDVEQIAYALSHDFKIPLKSIESLITIIKRKDITEEQKKVTINLLESKSEKLSNNMTGLIDLIKIENNKDS